MRIRGLKKSYRTTGGELTVLDGIDLDLEGGDELAITGPSGSGKSTLLHIIGGLDTPTAGTIDIDGRSLAELSSRDLADYRSHSVGFVFQDHHLLPQCTVLENTLIPTLAAGGATRERIDRARWLVERIGLGHRLTHRPAELSGGERQRVAIARALVNGPKLLLCDEPTGNLDRANAERIGDLLIQLAQDSRAILIVVTHSLELAAKLKIRMELIDGRLAPA
ncbi:ABC transporter ATP-binding protein [bacterium]|nr:ABC transporter ATP-binding protein [bacterium]